MTTHLPNGDRAILDIRKLEDYCLSPSHPRGRHKARVFRQALGLHQEDAVWLRAALLEAAATGEAVPVTTDAWGTYWQLDVSHQATSEARGGKNIVDCANRRGRLAARDMLGGVMKTKRRIRNEAPSLLDVVALLKDLPARTWRAAR